RAGLRLVLLGLGVVVYGKRLRVARRDQLQRHRVAVRVGLRQAVPVGGPEVGQGQLVDAGPAVGQGHVQAEIRAAEGDRLRRRRRGGKLSLLRGRGGELLFLLLANGGDELVGPRLVGGGVSATPRRPRGAGRVGGGERSGAPAVWAPISRGKPFGLGVEFPIN